MQRTVLMLRSVAVLELLCFEMSFPIGLHSKPCAVEYVLIDKA